jgi:ferric-dicitrate binding protein FerR (iron transport regulator)
MSEDIEILFAKYFAGSADEEQRKAVEEWTGRSDENRKEFERYRSLWQRTEIAAKYSDVEVEHALKQTKKSIPEFGKRRTLTLLRQAAAVLIVSLLISSLYNSFSARNRSVIDSKPVMQEVTAFYGMSTRIGLPDGSTVDLYPGSKLTFPLSFTSGIREVKLSGEGYFIVKHDEKVPFVVKTSALDVKVLGTKFNLKANTDEDYVETILVEGKVVLEKEIKGNTVVLRTLKPADRAVYKLKDGKINVFSEKNMQKHLAWTKGALVFDADPLEKVVKELERWYNVDIEIKDADLKKYKVTGKFAGEPIDEVLSLLQYSSGFRFKVENRKMKNGNLRKKKIVLMK